MSLTNTNDMVMPVAPMYSNGGNGFGFGNDGGAFWLLVLFLFAFNGGWGGGYGNGGAMPFMVNNDVQRGFDQSAIMGSLNGITSAISNGFATAEISRANTNTNTLQALWNMQMQQQNCCCDTRASIADLKYTVATEACADRSAVSDGVRDIIASNTANTQAILDKLCQQEIDALKTENARLQTAVNLANMQASQTAQTAQILADNSKQTAVLEDYLNPVPRPAFIVQNPNCCSTNYGCGCGM